MTTFVVYYCLADRNQGLTVEIEADDVAAALAQAYDDLEYKYGPDAVDGFSWIRIVRKDYLDSEVTLGKRPSDSDLRRQARRITGKPVQKRRKKKKRSREAPCTWGTLPESIRTAFQAALNERNSK